MKVAIVTRGIPDSQNLMNGIFEMDQAKALVKAGVEVKLLVVDLRSVRRKRKFGLSKVKQNGVDCYIISVPLGIAPYSVFCKVGTKALKKLYNYAYPDGEKPDLIHAHFTRQSAMAAQLAKETGLPLIVTEHSSDINKEEISDSLLKIAKKAYSSADKVIAVSNPLKKSIKEKTGVNSVVIPNIVDTDIFKPNEGIKEPEDCFKFVSVGGLIKRKRMDLLISAFGRIHKQYPDTRLVIFGRGAERDMLESLITSSGLDGSVELRGLVTRDEIAAQYQKADCFALLSERETFGVAYIEALAAGLPVVATKCSGPEDFMKEEFGCLIDINDENQAVGAMELLYKNIDKYSPDNISKEIKATFSPESVSESVIKIYREVLENR